MKHLFGTLVAILGLTSGTAFSATDWGVHAPSESVTYSVPSNSFRFDTISFSLASPSNLTLTGTPSMNGVVGQTGMRWGLSLLTPNGAASPFSVYEFPSGSYTFSGLSSGAYSIAVGVMSLAESDGSFNLTSTISAVPEPATYALLLVGLVIVGVMVRRRAVRV